MVWAQEPFTLLGISPTNAVKETTACLAGDRFAAWQKNSQHFCMPGNLQVPLDRARSILTDDSVRYKAFARRFLLFVNLEPKREVLNILLLRSLVTQHLCASEPGAPTNQKVNAREFAAQMLRACLGEIVQSLGIRGALHTLRGLHDYWGTWDILIGLLPGVRRWRRQFPNYESAHKKKAFLSISEGFVAAINIATEQVYSFWDEELIKAWEGHRRSPLCDRLIKNRVEEAQMAMNAQAEDLISIIAEHLVTAFSQYVSAKFGDGELNICDCLAYIEAHAEYFPRVLIGAAALSQMPPLLSDCQADSSLPQKS